MLDEDAFRSTRAERARLVCRFEKALLARCCDCRTAVRLAIADREAIACTEASASERCGTARTTMRTAAAFALSQPDGDAPLPHAAELKLQCGGLRGVRQAIGGAETDAIDVDALLSAAEREYGALAALPWGQIIRFVAAFKPRRRA